MSLGKIAFIGSGETASSGGKTYESLVLGKKSPLQITVLETPAGFELNAHQVAGRVSDYLQSRLQNYAPKLSQLAVHRRGSPGGADDQDVLIPLFNSDLVFLGPGSPTYTVRHLQDTLAWKLILKRILDGGNLAFASAAAIACGRWALPVYEIYKVGEDPFWNAGLDLLGIFGLEVAIFPHWNNRDGGDELDTRFCFMGAPRFELLKQKLPETTTIIGIDEHTSLVLDIEKKIGQVVGQGKVTIIPPGSRTIEFVQGESLNLELLGKLSSIPDIEMVFDPEFNRIYADLSQLTEQDQPHIPEEIKQIADLREKARLDRNWAEADLYREKINDSGWVITDTQTGYKITPK